MREDWQGVKVIECGKETSGETEERAYTLHKNVQSALKSNSLSLRTNEKVPVG